MVRFVFVCSLLLAGLSQATSAFAGDCCSSGCPDIIPCPPSEPITQLSCNPNIRVYAVHGYLEYWTELMRVERPCEYQPYLFEGMIFDASSSFDQATQQYIGLTKIIVHPWWANTIVTTQNIAHQMDWQDRRFTARGCFVTPDYFLAEWIDYER